MFRILFLVCLSLAPLAAAETTADALARLLSGQVDDGEVRTWQRLWKVEDRLVLAAVEAEATGDWQRCLDTLAPVLEASRERRQRYAFLATTLAEAMARTGHGDRARPMLAEALQDDAPIVQAAATLVAGRLALLGRDWDAAGQHLRQAGAILRRVDGSSDGMGWIRTLTDRRSEALARELAAAADAERLGEDFVAWREADRRAGEAPIGSAYARYLAKAVAHLNTVRAYGYSPNAGRAEQLSLLAYEECVDQALVRFSDDHEVEQEAYDAATQHGQDQANWPAKP